MTHDLPQHILTATKNSVTVTQYADDLAIWGVNGLKNTAPQNAKRVLRTKLQTALNAVQTYMTYNGFTLSAEKTQLIHFKRNKELFTPTLKVGDTQLAPLPQAKFLGVLFSENLNWAPHIHQLIRKASKALNLIKVVSNQSWGRDPKTLLHLAQALVRSRLQHGQECFFTGTKLHSLTSIDTRSIKIALGLPVSCSNAAAYAEAKIIPLEDNRRLANAKLIARAFSTPNSSQVSVLSDKTRDAYKSLSTVKNLQTITRHTQPLYKDIEIPGTVAQKVPPTLPPWLTHSPQVIIPKYNHNKTDSPQALKSEVLEYLHKHHSSDLQVFTDGSLLEDGAVGAGVAIPKLSTAYSYQIPKNLSIFSAELAAIAAALVSLQGLPPKPEKIIIGVDSQAALQAIATQNNTTRPDLIHSIHSLCHELLLRGHSLTLIWIPSHIGIRGNEMADAAAREGALATPRAVALDVPPSAQEIGTQLKKVAHKIWKERNSTFLLKKHYPCFDPASGDHMTPGPLSSLIRRLRTNSWRSRHLNLKCCCAAPLSPEHILLQCPTYATQCSELRAAKPASYFHLLSDPTSIVKVAKLLYKIPCAVSF